MTPETRKTIDNVKEVLQKQTPKAVFLYEYETPSTLYFSISCRNKKELINVVNEVKDLQLFKCNNDKTDLLFKTNIIK